MSKLAPSNIQSERFNICKECDENKMGICDKNGKSLLEFVPIASNACPIDKWGAVKEEN